MHDILVSVSITTYNHEKFIRECLDSVLMQKTSFDFEIVLGEDESSDMTRQICIEFAKKYNHINLFLRNRSDVIKINGRETGRYNFMENLKACRGKYIALCDGDDYWTDPYKLQKQVDFLEANPDYYIHSGNAKYRDFHRNQLVYQSGKAKTFAVSDFQVRNNLISLTVMFRNNKSINFELLEKYFFGDWGLYVTLIGTRNFLAYRSDEIYGVYRKHSGGITSNLSSEYSMIALARQAYRNIKFLQNDDYRIIRELNDELIMYKTPITNRIRKILLQIFVITTVNRLKKYFG